METLSTTIDTDLGPSASGGGQTALTEPAEPNSLRADIEAAMKETAPKAEPEVVKEEEPRAEGKPEAKAEKVEAKDAKDPETKPADDKTSEPKPEKAEDEPVEKTDGEQKEPEAKGRHPEAPSKFLPRAKELWRNTPNEVKAEVDRVLREAEEETTRVREATQRYEAIRPYDELARQNGRAGIHESLEEVRQLEDLMQQNPVAALNKILMQAGPRKADGQPLSLFEVASHIVQQGQQGYQQMVVQRPQQQQPNAEVQQLRDQIEQMQVQQAAKDIIEPFAAKHPRYSELQEDIAFFLQSGKIPSSLSAPERLAAAYDMAVRINPSSHAAPANQDEPASERRADSGFDGSAKSIKSSPGSVTEEVEDRGEGGESIRDSILRASRRLR